MEGAQPTPGHTDWRLSFGLARALQQECKGLAVDELGNHDSDGRQVFDGNRRAQPVARWEIQSQASQYRVFMPGLVSIDLCRVREQALFDEDPACTLLTVENLDP